MYQTIYQTYQNKGDNMMEKKDENLATSVINKLIKIIIYLIVFIFINNAIWIIGTFWYNSLPVEETEIIQDADTEGDNSPINQEIGE